MKILLSIIGIIKTFSKKLNDDCIAAFAAQATLFIIISFFPFLMFLLTLLRYVPINDADFVLNLKSLIPDAVYVLLYDIIEEVRQNTNSAIISITAISALWTASKSFLSIAKGFDNIYLNDKKSKKNFIWLRLSSVLYTLIFAIMIIVVLLIFVFGNRIAAYLTQIFPFINNFALLVISIRTVVGLGVLLFFFLFMYLFVPTRKSSLLAELPGAFITSIGWMGFSYLYSIYIDTMEQRTTTYGSLTAIVLCLLWLYFCMYIMFIGAEINSLISNSAIKEAIKGLFRFKNN